MLGGRFVRMGHEVAVVSAGGNLKEHFEEKGIRCVDFPIRTKNELSPKVFLALPKIIRFVKEEKFDLIHAHTRVTEVLACLVSKMTKVPYLTTAHGFYKRRLTRRLFGCWGLRVIAISPLVAEELEKTHKVKRSDIRIVQNAVDIEDFEKRLLRQDPRVVRETYGIFQDAKVIGSISRLVRDKGHEYLIEAVRDLKKTIPNIFLLIIGDGRERKRLESLIKKSGLEKEARIIQSQPDIAPLLSAMDIFAHPATYREGFGLSMVEAMVAKKPVLATNIWAINTIIRNRVNGFLVEPKKKEELRQALEFIIRNTALTASITQNAYDIATQLYSIDRMVSEIETVYQEVIGEKK